MHVDAMLIQLTVLHHYHSYETTDALPTYQPAEGVMHMYMYTMRVLHGNVGVLKRTVMAQMVSVLMASVSV